MSENPHVAGSIPPLDASYTRIKRLHAACSATGVDAAANAAMTDLIKSLKQQHPSLRDLGAHRAAILKVLRSLATILDALNPARNRGSLAHRNDVLLDESNAVLFDNAARTALQYLDAKLNSVPSISAG
jgi:hypothetical protein